MQVTRSGGVATRSGIADFDAVLGSIGVKALQRLFPVDERNEERTRAAGLHRWYVVEFDAAADLDKAALDMARIAEVSKVEFNQQLMHVHEGRVIPPGHPAGRNRRCAADPCGRRVQRSPPGQTMALHQHRRQVDLFEDQGGSRCQLRRGLEALHGRPARYRRGRGRLRAVGPSRPGRQHVDQHRRAERLGRP
ncbi:subtilase family N-terminal domain-containing protein [Alistipes shahii]|uniref:subtilase family N-terminal domain-containing protein n=1 Tax=Alistipes shahii TaxID=328814 RepID=UPI00241F6DF8|nr:subtilase family N-terminal domain-containing protein [Alistipes shahii]